MGTAADVSRVAVGARLLGVWHAAGVLADGMLPRQDAQMLQRVYRPKMHGATHLHSGTWTSPLNVCVQFSSVAALLGSAAQANYCAANGCLDALAAARRWFGAPAVSVQFGPWAEVGMAAANARVSSRMQALGIVLIRPGYALQVLQLAWHSSIAFYVYTYVHAYSYRHTYI